MNILEALKQKTVRIADKIFFSFVIVEILAIICISCIAYALAADNIKDIALSQACETVNQLSSNLSYQMETVCSIAENLSYNSDIQDILRTTPSISKEFQNMQIMAERIMVVNYSSTRFGDIEIFGDNGLVLSVPSGTSSFTEPDKVEEYCSAAKEKNGRIIWINEASTDGKMHLLKTIKDLNSMQDLGVIHISLKCDYLKQLFSTVDFSANGEIVLFDNEQKVIVGSEEGVDKALQSLDTQSPVIRSHSKKHLVLWQSQKQSFLFVCGIIPQDELFSSLRHIRTIILFSTLLLIVSSLYLSRQMSNSIVRPLQEMVDPMNEIARGNFDIKLNVDSNDEIGQLQAGFNIMTEKIKALFVDVYKSEILKKEAEFRQLQAQINPHFLYNTLNTIYWKAKINNMDDIAELIQAVSSLLRASVNNRREIITVEDEIKFVEDYLLIQTARYREKLFSIIEVPTEMRKLMIPKLILQPLVENAIEHGLENKKENGYVRISGCHDQNLAVFEVSDNGKGMSREKVAGLLKGNSDNEDGHTGLGLKTVHNRIQYIFGNEYGLTIMSVEGKGTTVRIMMPFEMCNEGLKERFERREEVDGKSIGR